MEVSTVEKERPVTELSLEELRSEYVLLRCEQHKLEKTEQSLAQKIDSLTEESVKLQQKAEVEEEKVANQLIRKMENVKSDLKRVESLLEEEKSAHEEVQRKIKDAIQKKNVVDSELAQNEDYILNKIQKDLLDVSGEKNKLQREINAERERYLALLSEQLAKVRATMDDTTSTSSLTGDNDASLNSSNPNIAPTFSASIPDAVAAAPSLAENVTETKHADPTQIGIPATTSEHPVKAHHTVVRIEQRLNKLLQEHTNAVKESEENEAMCEELAAKLKEAKEQAFLDRVHAAKLKEDLIDARNRFEVLRTKGETSSIEDSSSTGFVTPNRSMDVHAHSLRDRTKEVLSSAPRMSSSQNANNNTFN